LKLEWKIAEGGNSGIFYLGSEDEAFNAIYRTAPELQVLDNETLLLVQPNEIDKISTHIVTLLSDKELKNTMGQAAKEHVRKNFLITRLVRDYLLLIRYSMGLVKPSFAV